MPVDYIFPNGQGVGDVADRLLEANMDPVVLRPWRERRRDGSPGRRLQAMPIGTVNGRPKYKTVITNAPATLMKDQWIQMDQSLQRQIRLRLRVWNDIWGAGLRVVIPNGMSVILLQHQTITDAGDATLSMSPLRQANRDRPLYDIGGLPLPLIHSDFHFDLREILVSQRQGIPLDTGMIENSTRKCLEQIEKLMLGTAASYSYGGYTVYGMTNHPSRMSTTLTNPTAPGWTPETLVNEILDMLSDLQDAGFNGPYGIWYSPGWMKYLGADYAPNYPGTLRRRLSELDTDEEDIRFWHKTSYLTGLQIVIGQLTNDVMEGVQGMRLQTVQWDSHGGFQRNFKVIGMYVPRVRTTITPDGTTAVGINHGTA